MVLKRQSKAAGDSVENTAEREGGGGGWRVEGRLQSGSASFQPLTWKKKVTGHQEQYQKKKKRSIRDTLTLLQTPLTEKLKKKRKKMGVDTGGAVIVSLHIVENKQQHTCSRGAGRVCIVKQKKVATTALEIISQA